MLRFFHDSSIRAKAFAASVVLWICLVVLGTNAYVTLENSANGLAALSTVNLPRQQAVADLTSDLIATHVKIFRYVSWASNGVNPDLLALLRAEVLADLDALEQRLEAFSRRLETTPAYRATTGELAAKWRKYQQSARDNLDVGGTDAPLATTMLGGTDGDYQQVAADLAGISTSVTEQTRAITQGLAVTADTNRRAMALAAAAGVLVSMIVTLLVGSSIVRPIRSVTRVMTQMSGGDMDVAIGYRDRGDEIGQMVQAITVFRRSTERHNRLLEEHQAELRRQNLRFEAALDHMSQGLAVFDGEQSLVVCNKRFAAMFDLPAELTGPGTPLRDILTYRAAHGTFATGDIDRHIGDLVAQTEQGRCWTRIVDLADGRIVSISYQPMQDNGWLAMHEDITEHRRSQARIEHLAHHDSLTDLPNRVLLRERLEQALGRVTGGETLALLFLDLDNFKDVNDTLGHPVGDELLKAVSVRLRDCIREGETDTIARLGGDEFAVLQLADEQPAGAAALAQRIIEVIGAPYAFDGHQVHVAVSIGIALSPKDGTDPDRLLKSADIALYRAKSEGRGTWRFFAPEMDAATQARQEIARDLRTALGNGELAVFYQPIVDLRGDAICGFEALLRWRHPRRGLVPPREFIPVAEELGIIGPLGEWTLRQACAEAARWPADIAVAVNLSPVQFNSRNLVQIVVGALAASGLPAHRLELEITESVLTRNGRSNLAILHQLRDLGARISMDDFGTGHSSLSYLRSFPFDKIKIDSSFIWDMPRNAEAVSIVRAVAGLGNSLGMRTAAEGVETGEQLETVRAIGCSEVQGYIFSPPVPAHELATLLSRRATASSAA
jgi:diguanylate cyclase (GGDEF)-like protein